MLFRSVSFTPTTGSSTSLTGGAYPNDDLTQTPNTNYVITLGTQGSSDNGVYSSATLTEPDPQYVCSQNGSTGTEGTDANGDPTCTWTAPTVVGNTGSKYVIFLRTNGVELFLFQQ